MRISGNNFLSMDFKLPTLRSACLRPLNCKIECSIELHASRPSGTHLRRRVNLPSRNSAPVSCIARRSAGQSSKSVAKIFSTMLSSQLRHEVIQHDGRVSSFIGQASPVQIGRVPGFRQKTAGISREWWHGHHVQQFETVVLSQAGMRRAEIMRQALPVSLFGMLPAQVLQVPGWPFPTAPGCSGYLSPELRRQIEGVCRHHLRKHVLIRDLRAGLARLALDRCGSNRSDRMISTLLRNASSLAEAVRSSSPVR